MLAIADLVDLGEEAREWAVTLTKAIPKIPLVGADQAGIAPRLRTVLAGLRFRL